MGFKEGVRSASRVGSNDGWSDEVDSQGRFLSNDQPKRKEKKVGSVLLDAGKKETRERERERKERENGEHVRRTRRVRSPVLLRRG